MVKENVNYFNEKANENEKSCVQTSHIRTEHLHIRLVGTYNTHLHVNLFLFSC